MVFDLKLILQQEIRKKLQEIFQQYMGVINNLC